MEIDKLKIAKELELQIDKVKRQIHIIEELLTGDYILDGLISGRKRVNDKLFK